MGPRRAYSIIPASNWKEANFLSFAQLSSKLVIARALEPPKYDIMTAAICRGLYYTFLIETGYEIVGTQEQIQNHRRKIVV